MSRDAAGDGRRMTLVEWVRSSPRRAADAVKLGRQPTAEGAAWEIIAIAAGCAPVFVVQERLWFDLMATPYPPGSLPRMPFQTVVLSLPKGEAGNTTTGRNADDVVIFEVRPGVEWRLTATRGCNHGGIITDAVRVGPKQTLSAWCGAVAGLFALLEDRQIVERRIPPRPLGPKKQARLESRGRTSAGYTLLSLEAHERERGAAAGTHAAPRAHVRRGHWRRQWVLDAGERAVMDRMDREGRATLYSVRQWVRPTVVGIGTPRQGRYRVA